jgi:hypothetical protein
VTAQNDHERRDGTAMLSARVDAGIGIMAGLVSAILTIRLLIELGDSAASRVLLGVLAGVLEATKIRLWQRRSCTWRARALSVSLVGLSILASAGSALVIVNDEATRIDVRVASASFSMDNLEALKARRQIMLQKLSQMPYTWASRSAELATDISKIDAEIRDTQYSIQEKEGANRSSKMIMFKLLADRVRLDYRVLVFWFLLMIAVVLELAILSMVPDEAQPEPSISVRPSAGAIGDPKASRLKKRHKDDVYYGPSLFDIP